MILSLRDTVRAQTGKTQTMVHCAPLAIRSRVCVPLFSFFISPSAFQFRPSPLFLMKVRNEDSITGSTEAFLGEALF